MNEKCNAQQQMFWQTILVEMIVFLMHHGYLLKEILTVISQM